jgi:hypothetical protein
MLKNTFEKIKTLYNKGRFLPEVEKSVDHDLTETPK